MNAWSAVGSVLESGGAVALDYQRNESRLKAEKAKAESLERLRRQTNAINNQQREDLNRKDADYRNSLQTGGVDPETGLKRSNQWIAEHPDANVVGIEKYKADNRVTKDNRSAEERIIAKYFGGDANAYYAAKNRGQAGGKMSDKDRATILLKVADSDGYRQVVADAEAYNTEDTSMWPGDQLRPETDRKVIPSPEEYAVSKGLLPPSEQGPQPVPKPTQNTEPAPSPKGDKYTPEELNKALRLIESGERDFASMEKELGGTRPELVAAVKKAQTPAKGKKGKSNPEKWNTVMADAMDKALKFKLNPAEATGKIVGGSAQSAADNVPGKLKEISKAWGKYGRWAFDQLDEAGKALIAANDKLAEKMTTVTTEEDAKAFVDAIMKVVEADTYDYGTGSSGDVLETNPIM